MGLGMSFTDEERDSLIEAARTAAGNAYAPFSGFRVGAALITEDGAIHAGANVENTSYSLSMCAERVALYSAVSAGAGRPVNMAVVALGEDGRELDAPPCGACRQALFEFAPEMAVTYRRSGETMTRRLAELLPDPFGGKESSDG